MFQASHFARPLKSNIPGRSVDVQTQAVKVCSQYFNNNEGEGFLLCFNAGQKNCLLVALLTSGGRGAFNLRLVRSPASSIRYKITDYLIISCTDLGDSTTRQTSFLLNFAPLCFIVSTWSAESGTGSAQGLTHVDVSDCDLLVQGVQLAQFRVVRVLLQHLDLLRCLQEWFLLGLKERLAVTVPLWPIWAGHWKHVSPAKLIKTTANTPQQPLRNGRRQFNVVLCKL